MTTGEYASTAVEPPRTIRSELEQVVQATVRLKDAMDRLDLKLGNLNVAMFGPIVETPAPPELMGTEPESELIPDILGRLRTILDSYTCRLDDLGAEKVDTVRDHIG